MAQKNLLKGIRESLYQSCQFSFFSFFSSVFTQTIEPILDFYSFWKQIVQENLTLLNAVFSQSKKKRKYSRMLILVEKLVCPIRDIVYVRNICKSFANCLSRKSLCS